MCTARQMYERWSSLIVDDIAADAAADHTEDLEHLNRAQLMRGESAKGGYLRPLIKDDPYFKTPGAAAAYIAYKKRLTPETPEGVANLFINGYTHSKIKASVLDDKIIFDIPGLPWADEVDSKYEGQQLGLNEESGHIAWKEFIRAPFVQRLAELTGCKLNRR